MTGAERGRIAWITRAVVICLVITLSGSHLQRAPYFVTEPERECHYWLLKGSEITCHVEGIPRPSIVWRTHTGIVIPPGPTMDNESPYVTIEGTLVFPRVDASLYNQSLHAAFYRCVATNAAGTIVSPLVHVLAYSDFEEVPLSVRDSVTLSGTPAVLRCMNNRYSAAVAQFWEVSWIRGDGELIATDSDHLNRSWSHLVLPNGDLVIGRETLDHDFHGKQYTYRCRVKHKVTSRISISEREATIHKIAVQTKVAPKAVLHYDSVEIDQNLQFVVLPCVVTGMPSVNISFRYFSSSGSEIKGISGARTVVDESILSLPVSHVVTSGVHSVECRALNEHGELRLKTRLIHKSDVDSSKVRVSVEPSFQAVEIGSSLMLRCASSYLKDRTYKLAWFKDGELVKEYSTETTFHLKRFSEANAGVYQCIISNDNKEIAQSAAEIKIYGGAPVFSEVFDEMTVGVGEKVHLPCTAKGAPNPDVKWFLNGQPLLSTSNKSSNFYNITQVTLSDAGVYMCVASNQLGFERHLARLNVIGKLQNRRKSLGKKQDKHVIATMGATIQLYCDFTGYPVTSFKWTKESTLIVTSNRHRYHSGGAILTIEDAQPSVDQGKYVCEVTDGSTTVTSKTIVEFKIAPQIDTHFFPNRIEVDEGSRARLLCSVSKGDSPIVIRWVKDGITVETVADGSVQYSEDGAMIKFKKIRFGDRGVYTCFASNDVATVNHSTTVIVLVQPKWINAVVSNTTTVGTGFSTMLDCAVTGFPMPQIRWNRFDDIIQSYRPVRFNGRRYALSNGSLFINWANRFEDSGLYQCVAHNGVGSPMSRTIALQIDDAPEFENDFALQEVRNGSGVEILCVPHLGKPPMTFRWEKYYRQVDSTLQRYQIGSETKQSSLNITNTTRQDTGLYSCFASNSIGDDFTFIHVLIQEVPEVPKNIEVVKTQGRNITLRWKMPEFTGNSPLRTFVIWHRKSSDEQNGSPFRETVINGSENTGVIMNLDPVTLYEVKVAAENAIGRGHFSESVLAKTTEEVPSASPSGIAIHATGSQSLKVSWRPPPADQHNGVLQGYYVGFRQLNVPETTYQFKRISRQNTISSTSEQNEDGVASQRESTYLTNLKRQTKYGIVVRAFNNAGSGPLSDEVIAQTLETAPPTSPTIRVESVAFDSLLVRWNNRELAANTDYTLHYGTDKNQWFKQTLDPKQEIHIIQNLNCGTNYRLYVIASNSLGMGEPSPEVSMRTKGGPPVSASQSFVVTNATSATLLLHQWKSGGCPIEKFTVRYRKRNTHAWIQATDNIAGSTIRYVLTPLTPGTQYDIQVSAQNQAGATKAEFSVTTQHINSATSFSESISDIHDGLSTSRYAILVVQVALTLAVAIISLTVCTLLLQRYRKKPQIVQGMPRDLNRKKTFAEDMYIFDEHPSTDSPPSLKKYAHRSKSASTHVLHCGAPPSCGDNEGLQHVSPSMFQQRKRLCGASSIVNVFETNPTEHLYSSIKGHAVTRC